MVPSADTLRLLDEFTRDSLKELRNECFWGLIVFTALVLIGVALEEADSFSFLRISPRGFIDAASRHRESWIKRTVTVGWILLVVGVAGEGVFEFLVPTTDGFLQEFDDVLLTDAQRHAAEADERASVNAKEAARLNKLAEDERTARVNIERQLEWRKLTHEQRDKIRAQLSPFPTARVEVQSIMGDGEGSEYAEELADALKPSWFVNVGAISVTGRLPEGLHIYSDTDNWRSVVLQKTLKAAGIDADIRPRKENRAIVKYATGGVEIELLVGLKPRAKSLR